MAQDPSPEQDPGPENAKPLESLTAGAQEAAKSGRRPPVHLWNPPFCGDIDMRIAADGAWFYGGTPVARPALVRLFASILRRDPERYVLVTPVERVGIVVEDAPFTAVAMLASGAGDAQTLAFRTNVDDETSAGPDHPLRFETGPAGVVTPYVHVRDELWARIVRPVFYDLVELGEEREHEGQAWYGVRSGGRFFPMVLAADLETIA